MSKPEEEVTVFIVDDDPEMGILMKMVFEAEDFTAHTYQTGKEALDAFEESPPSVVLLDLKLPDMYGIDIMEKMKAMEPEVPVLILTGYGEVETAVQAIKKGAYHYLGKPFQNTELLLMVRKALAESRREHEIEVLHQRLSQNFHKDFCLGKSPAIAEVLKAVDRVGPTDVTVILQGESGVGKEVMARVLHHKSPRREAPFVALDCGTLPEGLVESELFGHERGAFTGADKRKLGQFELAHGGTLFLDEIANLELSVQAKLLRVIQERSIKHLGGRRQIQVDVRIIAASNKDLPGEVRDGRFREDLFHRLNEFTIKIPPLRDRKEDIPELAELFIREARRSLRKRVEGISADALDILKEGSWPGNIRQLKNTIRAGALMAEQTIEPDHIKPFLGHDYEPAAPAPPASKPASAKKDEGDATPAASLKEATLEAEKDKIIDALIKTDNNKSEAARLLNIDRSVLYDKMRKHGIPLK